LSLQNPSAEHDGKIMVIEEIDGVDGKPPRRFEFSEFEIKPLGYEDLSTLSLGSAVTIPLVVPNARILSADGVRDLGTGRFSTVLESRFSSKEIGLLNGGWLPCTLAAYHAKHTYLLDRNIVTEIVSRFDGGNLVGREPAFIDLFHDEPVRLNPLFYALEGNVRALPNPQQVKDQFDEAVEKIRKALPKAILTVGPQSIDGVLGLIEDSRTGMERRQQFLMRLAPSLQAPVAKAKIDEKWSEVLAAADDLGVSRTASVVLACLSVVCVAGGRSPAKLLLKFRPGYTVEDAYNALADLRSLDIFANLLSLYPDERMQLCTADKNLALFWTGIRASNFTHGDTGCRFDIDPVNHLIPDKFRDRWLNDVRGRG